MAELDRLKRALARALRAQAAEQDEMRGPGRLGPVTETTYVLVRRSHYGITIEHEVKIPAGYCLDLTCQHESIERLETLEERAARLLGRGDPRRAHDDGDDDAIT